jgi:3-dehydrosphinganine reductase
MIHDGIQGKLIFVSSTLGFVSFAGYAQYAPTKQALRGE